MTNVAKVMLSEFEAMLITNSEWILTKHSIIEKAGDLLFQQVGQINDIFSEKLVDLLPELSAAKPKVAKGERYKDLPYVILDYPALFSKTDVFAIRTMFWWGNFISVTLHLSGRYKQMFEATMVNNLSKASDEFYVSTGLQEWEHHFEKENYLPVVEIDGLDLQQKIMQPSFLKVALKYDLANWNNMDSLLKEAYSKMAHLLTH